jgi:transcriptional regulator
LVQDVEEITCILQDYVTYYEAPMPEPWRFDSKADFARQLAAQVVGFRVEISKWEAKWKLGQNQSSSRRRRTIAALEAQSGEGTREVAALMRATLDTDADG